MKPGFVPRGLLPEGTPIYYALLRQRNLLSVRATEVVETRGYRVTLVDELLERTIYVSTIDFTRLVE